jgi:hypothetical protein
MNFSCQWMALSIRESHDRAADQTTEQLLILQVSEAHSIEMALEELENTHVGRESILRILLLLKHQGFVSWKKLNLRMHWINASKAVSILIETFPGEEGTYSKDGSNSPCRH